MRTNYTLIAAANNSDPWAANRLRTHMKNGIVTPEDQTAIHKEAGYKLGERRSEAKKAAKQGEFACMRRA